MQFDAVTSTGGLYMSFIAKLALMGFFIDGTSA